jgi:hypothetical protein
MKNTVLSKVGSAFLIIGITFAVPAYAEKYGGEGTMGMGEKGSQQMSGMMHDISGELNEMSGMMGKGGINPDAMKKMSNQMKQMGDMMENMSGIVGRGTMMDANTQKQMDQIRKQMDLMRKDMLAAPAKK